MPRPPRIPAYRLHKARSKGVVTLNGRNVYLPGDYGSAESTEAYERLIARWLADGRRPPRADGEPISVAELLRDFLVHAQSYYRDAKREPTAEIDAFRYACARSPSCTPTRRPRRSAPAPCARCGRR